MAKVPLIKRNKPQEIVNLITLDNREKQVKNKLLKYHSYDMSEALLMLEDDDRFKFYDLTTPKKLASVLSYLDESQAIDFFLELDKELGTRILEFMEPDDAVDILQALSNSERTDYMSMVKEPYKSHLKRLSRYGKETAGSEMNARFISVTPEMDVKEAMKVLVKDAGELEAIDTLFVIDQNNLLLGVVDLKKLIVAKHPAKIESIMETEVFMKNVNDDLQETVQTIQRYDIMAMPIVNDQGQMEGVITMYDAMDIIEETSRDDYAKLAAVPSELSDNESATHDAKKRLPWLVLLLLLNVLVSLVLASFVDTIEQIVALVLFQPLILGMAGNLGTQSLAVTILNISKDNLRHKTAILNHIGKETLIGIINGLLLGLLALGTSYAFLSIASVGSIDPLMISIVVGSSVFIALTVSAFIGGLIPITLNAMKIDPAVASGPFITTINDISALIIYFTLAGLIILPTL